MLRNELLSLLVNPCAWCIARVRINRVTRETIEGRDFIRKERTPISWVLILLGNFVFRFRTAPLGVLHRRQWQQWEEAIHKALGAEVPVRTARGLLFPKISGKPLCDVLGANGTLLPFDDVLQRLRLALEALYHLHQIEIVVDGNSVLFSHGDASVTNAIISDDRKAATWLDFDLRHDLRHPASVRHADDLRAFMATGVVQLAVHEHSDDRMDRFLQTMKVAYPHEETWQRLKNSSGWLGNAPDVFSCAQRFRAKIALWRFLVRIAC